MAEVLRVYQNYPEGTDFRVQRLEPADAARYGRFVQQVLYVSWLSRYTKETDQPLTNPEALTEIIGPTQLEKVYDQSRFIEKSGDTSRYYTAELIKSNEIAVIGIAKARHRHVNGWFKKSLPVLDDVSVIPGYQRLGIGSALIDTALAEFRPNAGPTSGYAYLENRAAVNWYERLGFKRVGPSREETYTKGFTAPMHLQKFEGPPVRQVRRRLYIGQPAIANYV